MLKLKKYRIVRNAYIGYKCEVWRLWFPFWCQMGLNSAHKTIEQAKDYIHNRGVVWISS